MVIVVFKRLTQALYVLYQYNTSRSANGHETKKIPKTLHLRMGMCGVAVTFKNLYSESLASYLCRKRFVVFLISTKKMTEQYYDKATVAPLHILLIH
jgi:hypothetical protein